MKLPCNLFKELAKKLNVLVIRSLVINTSKSYAPVEIKLPSSATVST